jgi:hypothetical protein
LLAAAFTAQGLAQQSTRKDFDEYCQVVEGRWVGEVTLVADWPGIGEKGEVLTAYSENEIKVDGNALTGMFYGGNGAGKGITVFDAGSGQIKGLAVSSGGSAWNVVTFKKNGKWVQTSTGSNPDGTKIEGVSTLTISDDGNTHTWIGTTTIDGKEVDKQRDVWRRVSQ